MFSYLIHNATEIWDKRPMVKPILLAFIACLRLISTFFFLFFGESLKEISDKTFQSTPHSFPLDDLISTLFGNLIFESERTSNKSPFNININLLITYSGDRESIAHKFMLWLRKISEEIKNGGFVECASTRADSKRSLKSNWTLLSRKQEIIVAKSAIRPMCWSVNMLRLSAKRQKSIEWIMVDCLNCHQSVRECYRQSWVDCSVGDTRIACTTARRASIIKVIKIYTKRTRWT